MQIKKQKENKLLGRIEVEVEIAFTGATPSRESVRKELAKEMKIDEKLVIVNKIDNNFGEGVANIYAHVYKKDKDADGSVSGYMKKRHEVKAKEEKAEESASAAEEPKEKSAEEKKEEVPAAETPKEEPKPEEKKEEPETEGKPAEKAPKEEETTKSKDSEPRPEVEKPEEPKKKE